MNKILPLSVLGAAIVSLAACTGTPSAITNAGGSGVSASAVGTSAPRFINSCPASGTALSGGAWHPGDYCVPGGRRS